MAPSVRYGSPTNGLPQNEFTQEEDLGVHDMEGLPVHGVRQIQTIPAENEEIAISDEYRYAEDLGINLMIKHSDPRRGTVRMAVTQVTRTAAESALFEIPEGYKPAGATRENKPLSSLTALSRFPGRR